MNKEQLKSYISASGIEEELKGILFEVIDNAESDNEASSSVISLLEQQSKFMFDTAQNIKSESKTE